MVLQLNGKAVVGGVGGTGVGVGVVVHPLPALSQHQAFFAGDQLSTFSSPTLQSKGKAVVGGVDVRGVVVVVAPGIKSNTSRITSTKRPMPPLRNTHVMLVFFGVTMSNSP